MPAFRATEGSGEVEITVARLGDTSVEADVDYSTRGVTASERSDYTTAAGRLHFAPFETAKSFPVLITEDSIVEGQEFAQLVLDDPSAGATVDVASLSILDDAVEPITNASDDAALYRRSTDSASAPDCARMLWGSAWHQQSWDSPGLSSAILTGVC